MLATLEMSEEYLTRGCQGVEEEAPKSRRERRIRERRPPREAGPQPEAGKPVDISLLEEQAEVEGLSKEGICKESDRNDRTSEISSCSTHLKKIFRKE